MSKANRGQSVEKQDPWDALEHAIDSELSALLVLQKSLKKDLAPTDPAVIVSRATLPDVKAEAEFLRALENVEKLFSKADAACKTIIENPDRFQIPTTIMQQRIAKVNQWKNMLHRPRDQGTKIQADQARRAGLAGKTPEDIAREAHNEANQNYLQSQQELQNAEMELQDAGATRVLALTNEIKQSAINIHDELNTQEAMMNDVDRDMGTVQHKIAGLNKKVQTLLDNSSDKTKIMIIIILMVILAVMIFILFS